MLPFPAAPRSGPAPPRRHVVEAAGAAAGAAGRGGGACTARSSGPRARTLTSGCSLHQVTPRSPEAGRAHPQRRSFARSIPLTELGTRRGALRRAASPGSVTRPQTKSREDPQCPALHRGALFPVVVGPSQFAGNAVSDRGRR